MMRYAKFAAVGAAAILLTAGCGSDSGDGASTDDGLALVTSGTLTQCTDAPYEPFDYEKDGKYTGLDVELLREIAKRNDLTLKVQQTGFDGIQSGAALNSGQCDVAGAAMTITPEREKHLDFSDPYYNSLQSLLVPNGSPITKLEELSGKKLGVQSGTTGADYAKEHAPKDADLISFDGEATLYQALKAGNVDAVLQDFPVNARHAQEGDFTVVQEYDTGEKYGFAVKKDRTDGLLADINDALAAMKKDGTYDDIYQQFFHEAPPEEG